ncbi:MAG: Omp85 family outer membrane protein [Mariniphaga sp.]
MKTLYILILLFIFPSFVNAQDDVVKTGWNFGALPSISFDSDLGFQYGALVNLFDYGEGSRYPAYDHSLYFEVSRYTKGSGINRFYYDSDRLLRGIQTTVDLSYLSDQAYDFYGFNGYEAVVNPGWTDDNSQDYVSRMFYKYDRRLFRFKVDLQGPYFGRNLKWLAGINLLNFKIGPVDIDQLNEGKAEDELLPDVDGLYEKYQEWAIISQEEADGGFIPELKAGLVYDTRDNRPNPMRGIWTEASFVGVPEFLGAESSFVKFNLTHRQYFTVIPEDLSLAYRLSWQSTIAGQAPFYYQTQIIVSEMRGATSEGLGGSKTLRGINRNRVVGDGIFYGNIEARWKFARFSLLNNNFYLGLNGFTDFGRALDRIDLVLPDAQLPPEYFNPGAESMHFSYGAGLRVAMNQNFIIAVDYGIAADERDGDSGLYIGLNYLF